MPSQSYGPSMNLPVIFSGGLSPTDYGTPWDLKNLNQWRNDEPHLLTERIHQTSVVPEVSFIIEGEMEVIIKKLIGLALLAYMPETGLDEALLSLKDIFEFNMEKARFQLPEPTTVMVSRGIVSKVLESPI